MIYVLSAILLWNLITFSVTASDKAAAKRKKRRVPEKFFLWAAFLGGGAGVLSAFYVCRHKTKHYGLLIKTWLLTLLSYTAAAGAYIVIGKDVLSQL